MLNIIKNKDNKYVSIDDLEDMLLDMIVYLTENNVNYTAIEVLSDVLQIFVDITKEEEETTNDKLSDAI